MIRWVTAASFCLVLVFVSFLLFFIAPNYKLFERWRIKSPDGRYEIVVRKRCGYPHPGVSHGDVSLVEVSSGHVLRQEDSPDPESSGDLIWTADSVIVATVGKFCFATNSMGQDGSR